MDLLSIQKTNHQVRCWRQSIDIRQFYLARRESDGKQKMLFTRLPHSRMFIKSTSREKKKGIITSDFSLIYPSNETSGLASISLEGFNELSLSNGSASFLERSNDKGTISHAQVLSSRSFVRSSLGSLGLEPKSDLTCFFLCFLKHLPANCRIFGDMNLHQSITKEFA